MSRRVPLGMLALMLASAAGAAEMELAIDLPATELLLPPVSPPHLQREGTSLIAEARVIEALMPLLGSANFEGALGVLRDQRESVMERIEAGDPDGTVRARAVPGGVSYGAGTGLVSAALLFLIGHTYLSLEQYLPAEVAFNAALVALPDYLRVHESLGLLYLRTERYTEARTHLARAAGLGLNTAALHAALGYLNHETANYWGAASAFQQALVTDPHNTGLQRGLLHALSETRQYDAASALVEHMLGADPDDHQLWLYRAHIALLRGAQPIALSSLEAAIRLGDDSVANKQVAATLHMQRGSVPRAVELLKSGRAQGLSFEFVDQALGWLTQQGQWDELGELLAFLDEDRTSLSGVERSKVLTRQAALGLQKGERREARAALQEAADLDPANAEALMALGHVYRDDRELNRAELMFQRASVYDLFRESAMLSLAQLAIDQEDFERALDLLRDVVERNPARADLYRNIDSLENLLLLRAGD